MKVTRKVPKHAEMFTPIVIKLETHDEALAMWHRLNIPTHEVATLMDLTEQEILRLRKVEMQMLGRFDDEYYPDEEFGVIVPCCTGGQSERVVERVAERGLETIVPILAEEGEVE